MVKNTHLRIVLGLLVFVAPQIVFAQASNGAYPTTVPQTLIMLATHGFSLLIHIMFYAFNLLDGLLDPEFFNIIMESKDANGEPVESSILSIWRFSRDVVNTLFAVMLVVLALVSVVKADLSIIKTNIAKLVAAIILVNFSWFAPRVVIDFSNVLTASIYALPNALNSECVTNTGGECLMVANVIVYGEDAGMSGSGGGDMVGCYVATLQPSGVNNTGRESYTVLNETICLKLSPLPLNNNQLKVFHGLFANYSRIMYAGKLPVDVPSADDSNSLKSLGQIVQFFVKLMLNLLLTAAVAFPIIALTAILIVRIFVMWICIAFIPFAFIGFLIGDKLGSANPMQIWTKFWHNALLPAVLAVPFTVGFIIMNAISSTVCPFNSTTDFEKFCDPQKLPILNVNTWWEFLLYLFAIAVIYFGFFTATKFDSIAEKIGGFVKGFGDFAMKAPLALPLPIPNSGGKSIAPLEVAKALSSNNLNNMLADGRLDSSDTLLGTLSQNKLKNQVQNLDAPKQDNLKKELRALANKPTSINESSIRSLATAMRTAGLNKNSSSVEIKAIASQLGVNNVNNQIADKISNALKSVI